MDGNKSKMSFLKVGLHYRIGAYDMHSIRFYSRNQLDFMLNEFNADNENLEKTLLHKKSSSSSSFFLNDSSSINNQSNSIDDWMKNKRKQINDTIVKFNDYFNDIFNTFSSFPSIDNSSNIKQKTMTLDDLNEYNYLIMENENDSNDKVSVQATPKPHQQIQLYDSHDSNHDKKMFFKLSDDENDDDDNDNEEEDDYNQMSLLNEMEKSR